MIPEKTLPESEHAPAGLPGAFAATVPLCVDLDGTVIRTDLLWETFVRLLKSNPACLFLVPFWLAKGRACLKRQVASRVQLDPALLPYHPEVLDYLKNARAAGRRLILTTGSDSAAAQKVAAYLGLFAEVIGSDGAYNLSGRNKARALSERFGKNGFDYIGDRRADLPVWAEAREALLVSSSRRLAEKARAVSKVEKVFQSGRPALKTWLRALRVHQYAKNLLVLVPLACAHKWMDPARLSMTLLGVAAFSICASSVYILNDLLDLDADRLHRRKRARPFASGELPISRGLVAVPVCLAIAAALAFSVNGKFAAALGIYYLITLLYSLRLKAIELLDVLALAGLYVIRVIAGGCAARVVVSDWLLTFCMFFFLSLAFAKRFTELRLTAAADDARLKGRGYLNADTELIGAMGIASGYLSILVLGMYVTQPVVTELYLTPHALWLACPILLYWVSRVWLLAHRGQMHDDPIIFALKDRQSWIAAAIIALLGIFAGPK